ncbi:MAG: cysteine hydrolase family protein [Vulcanimicrobiaceae bacterium]
MNSLSIKAALLVIDVQQGFDHPKWGRRNNPRAEENIALLLSAWRTTRRPIFHVRHLSTQSGSVFEPGKPGSQIKEIVSPLESEPVIIKHVNSAFIGTDLEPQLRERHISELVVTGLTTDHCVSTTTRMAANLDFEVSLVADATATFERIGPDGLAYSADQIHDIHLASLHGEFATIVNTAEMLRSASERNLAFL